MNSVSPRVLLSTIWLISIAFMVGCGGTDGPPRFSLEGTVTYDGKPLPAGEIIISPDKEKGNEGPQTMARVTDGKYATAAGKGHVGGPHIMTITGFDGKQPEGPEGGMQPYGATLFSGYVHEADLAKEAATENIDIPAQGE